MLYRCKACGGNLNIDSKSNIGTCEYCGTKQPIQNFNDEHLHGLAYKDRLFERAMLHLSSGEYKFAVEYFDRHLDEYPKDYRAWWGKVLANTKNLKLLPYGNNEIAADYQKALRFAPTAIRQKIKFQIDVFVNAAIEIANKEILSIIELQINEDRKGKDIAEHLKLAQQSKKEEKNRSQYNILSQQLVEVTKQMNAMKQIKKRTINLLNMAAFIATMVTGVLTILWIKALLENSVDAQAIAIVLLSTLNWFIASHVIRILTLKRYKKYIAIKNKYDRANEILSSCKQRLCIYDNKIDALQEEDKERLKSIKYLNDKLKTAEEKIMWYKKAYKY